MGVATLFIVTALLFRQTELQSNVSVSYQMSMPDVTHLVSLAWNVLLSEPLPSMLLPTPNLHIACVFKFSHLHFFFGEIFSFCVPSVLPCQ